MAKSTFVMYFAMFAVWGVGLWGVLSAGSRLKAPHDLSGFWQAEADRVGGVASTPPLTIDQSGRFLRVHVGQGPAWELRWAGERTDPASGERVIRLTGKWEALTVRVPATPGPYVFERSGPDPAVWRARRQAAGAAGKAG